VQRPIANWRDAKRFVFPDGPATFRVPFDDRDVFKTCGSNTKRETPSACKHLNGPHAEPPQASAAIDRPSVFRSSIHIPRRRRFANRRAEVIERSCDHASRSHPIFSSKTQHEISGYVRKHTLRADAKSIHEQK
jgi:hypothetical protein